MIKKVSTEPKKDRKLKYRDDNTRVRLLKVYPYVGHPIYLRMIGQDYFEYSLIFNNELYSSYIIMKPKKGKKKLSKKEIDSVCVIILSGAMATIDSLIVKEKEINNVSNLKAEA